MMESGEVLFFATSSWLQSRSRFLSPRSNLFRHHLNAIYATCASDVDRRYAADQTASYLRPWAKSAQMTRAILFAWATTATFQCFVCSNLTSQGGCTLGRAATARAQ